MGGRREVGRELGRWGCGSHCWEVSLSWKHRPRKCSLIPRVSWGWDFPKGSISNFPGCLVLLFHFIRKKLSAPAQFFAEFTRHDRLYMQYNKMLNSTNTFLLRCLLGVAHSAAFPRGIGNPASWDLQCGLSTERPALITPTFFTSFCSLLPPLSTSPFPLSQAPHICMKFIPYHRVYV